MHMLTPSGNMSPMISYENFRISEFQISELFQNFSMGFQNLNFRISEFQNFRISTESHSWESFKNIRMFLNEWHSFKSIQIHSLINFLNTQNIQMHSFIDFRHSGIREWIWMDLNGFEWNTEDYGKIYTTKTSVYCTTAMQNRGGRDDCSGLCLEWPLTAFPSIFSS